MNSGDGHRGLRRTELHVHSGKNGTFWVIHTLPQLKQEGTRSTEMAYDWPTHSAAVAPATWDAPDCGLSTRTTLGPEHPSQQFMGCAGPWVIHADRGPPLDLNIHPNSSWGVLDHGSSTQTVDCPRI